jgi:hypothetical protein
MPRFTQGKLKVIPTWRGEKAMNRIGFLHSGLAQASAASPWALLVMKATRLPVVAWLIFFSLARMNSRWRALLWREVSIGLVLLAICTLGLPGLNIRVAAPTQLTAEAAPLQTSPQPGTITTYVGPRFPDMERPVKLLFPLKKLFAFVFSF